MPSTVSRPGVRRGRYSPYPVLLVALAAVLSATSLTELSRSFGQGRKQPTAKTKFQTLVKAGKLANKEEEAFFDEYVQRIVDEVVAPETLDAKLPDKRAELKKVLLRDLGKPAAKDLHDRANQLVLDACVKAIEDTEKDPRIRYNCVVMVGELDSPEGYVGGPPAAPWNAANAELLKILGDAKQHLAVRLAALVGLDHEVTVGLPADAQAKLVEAMTAVLKSPIEEVTEGQRLGQIWLRFRIADFMESLAETGVAVDKGVVATALAALATDEKNPIWMRCDAAGGLGRIEARDLSGLEVAPTVQMLAGLAMTSLSASPFASLADDEAEDADETKDDKENDAEKGDKPRREPPSKNAREKYAYALWAQLDQVRVALSGVSSPTSNKQPQTSDTVGLYAAADDATKQAITEMLKQIDATIKHLRAPTDLVAISKSIVDAQDALHQFLNNGAEAATAEAATAEAAKPAPARRTGGPPSGNNPATSPVGP